MQTVFSNCRFVCRKTIKLGPIRKPDGTLIRALGNFARSLLILFCLVAWMPYQATAANPAFANNASIGNERLVQNWAMDSVTLPEATGGNGTLTYSISPALPAGLSFDATTRVLSGTPTGASPSATYTYTVTDADNATARLTFKIKWRRIPNRRFPRTPLFLTRSGRSGRQSR